MQSSVFLLFIHGLFGLYFVHCWQNSNDLLNFFLYLFNKNIARELTLYIIIIIRNNIAILKIILQTTLYTKINGEHIFNYRSFDFRHFGTGHKIREIIIPGTETQLNFFRVASTKKLGGRWPASNQPVLYRYCYTELGRLLFIVFLGKCKFTRHFCVYQIHADACLNNYKKIRQECQLNPQSPKVTNCPDADLG